VDGPPVEDGATHDRRAIQRQFLADGVRRRGGHDAHDAAIGAGHDGVVSLDEPGGVLGNRVQHGSYVGRGRSDGAQDLAGGGLLGAQGGDLVRERGFPTACVVETGLKLSYPSGGVHGWL
jgi:hypothetical protein